MIAPQGMFMCLSSIVDCGDRGIFSPEYLLRGAYTPCCRNLWWWDDQGELHGPKYVAVFCEKCHRSVCQEEKLHALRSSSAVVFHEDCIDKMERT